VEAVQAVPELPAGLTTEVAVPPPEGPNSNAAAKEASKQNNIWAIVKTFETRSSAPDDKRIARWVFRTRQTS
ncbi:uncharacterized protein PgNI_11617, partial [Pyricularia grisea]|uniref:Uncharacterized protein n=1 Tax=Pyricularia grisea TaxID=148305 RepID=A0A6P8ANN1_PYRGI